MTALNPRLKKNLARLLPIDSQWCMEESYWQTAVQQFSTLDLAAFQTKGFWDDEGDSGASYGIEQGIAIFSLDGPMTKNPTCASYFYGGTSTSEMAEAVRAARRDPNVRGALIRFDTPGGQVAGTSDLAEEIAAFAAEKQIWGYISDLCASAGYWCGSQCNRIEGNRTAMVGSIGTYMVVSDISKAAEMRGITYHVINAGEFKGAGTPGVAITDKQKAEWKRTVSALNAQFLGSVAAGRGFSAERMEEIADGRVHVGADAVALGLMDAVGSYNACFERLLQATRTRPAVW